MAVGNGRLSVTNVDDGGTIAAGAPADLLLLDWAALDDDRLYDRIDPLDLLFSRAAAKHISELIVAGRTVVKDGKVLGADLPAARAEVIGKMRAAMLNNAAFAAALPALERVVGEYFEPGCC
jgi:cytosine/adenosine deaminase-related metal-dependent hydrolase